MLLDLRYNAPDAMAGAEQRRLRVSIRRRGGQYLLRIGDTGGIADENLTRVFAPFLTSKPIGQG